MRERERRRNAANRAERERRNEGRTKSLFRRRKPPPQAANRARTGAPQRGEPSASGSAAPKRRTERERERRTEAESRARAGAPHRSGKPSASGSAAAKRPAPYRRIFMFKYTLFLLRKNCRSGGFYAAAPVKTAKNYALYTKTSAVIWSKHSNYKNV